jgi:hypothetical protein
MFNFSTQASTYLILVIITSIINLICYFMIAGVLGFLGYLVYVLFTVPLIILWMYNIDCLTTGDCIVWSWVITTLTLISILTSTIFLVAVTVNPSLSGNMKFTTIFSSQEDQNTAFSTTQPVTTTTPVVTTTPATTTPAATTPVTTTPAATTTPPAATTTTPPAATTTTPPAAPPVPPAAAGAAGAAR